MRRISTSVLRQTATWLQDRFPRAPTLLAFDKRTGETLHEVELDAAPTGTPMTYMRDGRQYIVVAYGTANDAGLVALALN